MAEPLPGSIAIVQDYTAYHKFTILSTGTRGIELKGDCITSKNPGRLDFR